VNDEVVDTQEKDDDSFLSSNDDYKESFTKTDRDRKATKGLKDSKESKDSKSSKELKDSIASSKESKTKSKQIPKIPGTEILPIPVSAFMNVKSKLKTEKKMLIGTYTFPFKNIYL
jgi:hypothetical protein